MRKFILAVLLVLVLSFPAYGAGWSVAAAGPVDGIVVGNYAVFGLTFTSDGNALSARDLIANDIKSSLLKKRIQGRTLYAMNVCPGTSGVAPNAAFDITITNDFGKTLLAATSVSHTADSWPSVTATMSAYPPILTKFNVAFGDIGDSGDQVTVYFYFWVEPVE